MWRNKIIQIISTHVIDIGKLTNRTLSAKIPDKSSQNKAGAPKKKCLCPDNKPEEVKEKKPNGSPCEKYAKKKPTKNCKPCGSSEKSPQDDCNKKSKEKFSNNSEINCEHHKTFIPPRSVLQLLQSFEIKSKCESSLTKTTGF